MDLPRPRPYGTEGGNSSHDCLSVCPRPSSQQHPLPSSSQAAYLKTQNFLQPLEQLGKACAREEIAAPSQISGTGKSTSEKRLLPGGIGTYSIRHVSNSIPVVPKAEGSIFRVAETCNAEKYEDDSNCTSFLGVGFSLWEESAGKMGKTGKENAGDSQWLGELTARIPSGSMKRPSQSSSNNHHNNFSSLSSSQITAQKNQSFTEIIKSAKGSPRDGEKDDDDEEFVIKKETSPTIAGELRIKVNRKSSDQKANTPRSKHSATEQRRRSKINDRLQKLRELIPHSDQKRDKASFLLEVVEYIQILQQKVDEYESSYQGLNHESRRLSPWNNNQRTTNPTRVLHAGSYPAVVFAGKFIEKHVSGTSQNPVDSDKTAAPTVKVDNLRPPTTNEELTNEADTNSISSVYSQGLLNSLTRALQSSGVDLSKTSLSVQIELGTKTNSSAFSPDSSTAKDVEIPSTNVGSPPLFRVAAAAGDGDSERTMKKLKSGRS